MMANFIKSTLLRGTIAGIFGSGMNGPSNGPLENMAKHSEIFTAATWNKNGGSCSVTSNSILAPDGNQTRELRCSL